MIDIVLSFTAILFLAFGIFSISETKAESTPIISIAIIMNIVILFSLVNKLKFGISISYFVALLIFLLSLCKNKELVKEKLREFFTPGVIFFIFSSIFMLIFLICKKPMVHQWDEYSFWGMSRKLIKEHGSLYTYFNSSMLGQSYPPALPLLVYFFQPFGNAFSEWSAFFAYDVLFFACFCSFTANIGKKNWHISFMAFLTAFLMPYFFAIKGFQTFMEPTYISLYSDLPLALVFSSIIAVYFFSEDNNEKDVLKIIPLIVLLTFIKDMGFALSCIAVFIIFFDLLVGKRNFIFFKIKGFFAKCLATFSIVFTTFVSFFMWSYHMGKVIEVDRNAIGGSAGMSPVGVVLNGIRELLIGPQSEKFATVEKSFISALFNRRISMIGSGVIVIAVITIIFIIAFILGSKNNKKRCISMYITTFIGFIGYYIFHLFLYVYVFGNEAYTLASYERYISVYYIAWLNIALLNLYRTVKEDKKLFTKISITGFALCVLFVFIYFVRPENMFTGLNENMYGTRKSVSAKADIIRNILDKEDVVYLYCGDNSGERWFTYTFELSNIKIIPNQEIDYSDNIKENRKKLYDLFKKYEVSHIVIDISTDSFEKSFSELFDVPMDKIGGNEIACYKVNYGDGMLSFTLEKEGIAEID